MHLSYTVDNIAWRAELGAELLAYYAMTEDDLGAWHAALFPQGRLWQVPKRLYAIHPAFGAKVVEIMPQTVMEIAAAFTPPAQGKKPPVPFTEKEVQSILARSRQYWERMRPRIPEDSQPPTAEADAAADKRAREILVRFGFKNDTRQEVREYMLWRIRQLEAQLESDDDRPAAMQMLRNEASLNFSVNPSLSLVQAKISRICQEGEEGEDYHLITSLQAKEADLIKTAADLQKSIEDAKASLNLGESITGRSQQKERLQGDISYLNGAIDEWHRDGTHTRIDQVFTEGEAKILLKAYGDRPAQYRIEPAMMIETLIAGLHDPDFEEVKIGSNQRDTKRKLAAGFRAALERYQAEEGPMENLQDDPEEAPQAIVATPHGAHEENPAAPPSFEKEAESDDEPAYG